MLLKIIFIIFNLIFFVKFLFAHLIVDSLDQNETLSAKETSMEKYLKNEIRKPWVKKLTEMAEEIGEIKYKLKLHAHLKMMVTTLSNIENIEEKFTRNLTIIIPNDIVDMFEKRNEEHKQRFSYILKENIDDIFVIGLKKRIQMRGMSMDEFSHQIAEAHHILSQTIQDMVLNPGTSRHFNTKEYKRAREALRIFMSGFKTHRNIMKIMQP